MKTSRRTIVVIGLLLGAVHVYAQRRGSGDLESSQVQVRVVNDAGRPVNMILRVELLPSGTETPIAQVHTETDGMARLNVAPGGGTYQLRISGSGIETMVTGIFTVERLENSHLEVVKVKLKQPTGGAASSGMSSASDYSIPKNAKKEMDAAAVSLHASDWKGAQQHFEAAIKAYPKYDRAYYGLGLAKQNLGDTRGAKEAFQQAIALNDHNADAERDLGRVLEGERDWKGAEDLLTKSLSVDQNSAASLTLLAIAQIQQGKVDDAIASASKVHALDHKPYAMAHLVLARAYESKSEKDKAVAEYKMFLEEEPSGPRADEAKKDLAKLTEAAN